MAVDAHGMPVRDIITDGTAADCAQASQLVSGINAHHLLADQAYDTDAIVAYCEENHIQPVIPLKCNRKKHRPFDKDMYRLRHLIENAFLRLKRWRGIATRYAKNSDSFLAVVQIRCLALWLEIS